MKISKIVLDHDYDIRLFLHFACRKYENRSVECKNKTAFLSNMVYFINIRLVLKNKNKFLSDECINYSNNGKTKSNTTFDKKLSKIVGY